MIKLNVSSFIGMVLYLLAASISLLAQEKLTLQKSLQTARLNNLYLQSEKFNINIGKTDIVTSRLRPNLTLNNQTLQLAQNRNFYENTTWSNAHNRQVWWQLTKTFQLPNQRRYKIDVAEKSYQFNAATYAETERNLYLDVATKWLDVWKVQKQLQIIQMAKINIDTLVKISQLRLKNQVISQTDFMRTQLLSDQYDLQLKLAQQEVLNKTKEFKLLLGVRDSISIEMTEVLQFNILPSLDSLLGYALRNRADIQAANTTLQISESNIKLQKSLAYPQPVLGAIWNPQNTIGYLGFFGTIDIPLFNRNQGEIQKSAIQKQKVQQTILSIQAQIETEIRTAYTSVVIHNENLKKFTTILNQSEIILSNVRYAYLRGGTTMVDFLEAQRSWLETQQQYFDTFQQYRQSYIQLLYSTGLINQLAQTL